ncbi:hypothetical protein [Pararhizobium sp.]|uniref:hypothetical protein n=1 Tax=Pararhizobium sp. TaxID=1977563 RepID=UPI003D0B22C2
MRIVHERVLGNVQLSHQLFVILADNGNMDRYTITPSESFIQRCCWLYLEPDKDTWVQWAESTGVHPNAMAYAKSRWENVSAELQYEDYAQSQSWLTRRCGHHLNAIEQVLDDLHGQIDVEDVVRPLVQGCIGAAEAIEYIALRGGTDVTYDEITAGTAAVPSTIDHCNLILSSVIMPNIAGTNQSGCELVAGYIKQWPREAAKTAFTAIAKGCPGITDTAAYMAWDIPF